MEKKIIFISIFFLIIGTTFTVSASHETEENTRFIEFSNDHYSFIYPDYWDKNINSLDNVKIFQFNDQDSDLNLMLSFTSKNNEEIKQNNLKQSYEESNKLLFSEVISFEKIILDSHEGKKLILEAHEPHHMAEQLYYELENIQYFYEDLNEKMTQYEEVKLFVSEIIKNQEEREEFKTLAKQKNIPEEIEDEELSSIYIVEGLIDWINNYLKERKPRKIISKSLEVIGEKFIISGSFGGEKEKYQNEIENIRKMIDSIKIK